MWIRRFVAACVGAAAAFTLIGSAQAADAGEPVAPRPIVSGWLYQWSVPPADYVAVNNGGASPEVNVIWAYFGSASKPICTVDSQSNSGCLTTQASNPTLRSIRDSLQSRGVKVFATIADIGGYSASQREGGKSDGAVLPEYMLTEYLATPERRSAYATQIANWAEAAGVEGVDLDWENFAWSDGSSTWATTRPRWIAMMKVLSARLHAKGLLLSATVPGTTEPAIDAGYTSLAGLYAWTEIAPYVDRLRLMTYDWSYSRPGPIGPQWWVDRVFANAVGQVGAAYTSKLWLGVAQYGRDWWARDDQDDYITDAACPADWTPNETGWDTLVPSGAWSRAAAVGATVANGRLRWDEDSKEWTYYYLDRGVAGTITVDGKAVARTCNARREVWFSDAKSAVWRSKLVAKYQLGGIAVWNLTDIMDDFYPSLITYARTIAQQPTTVAVTAPKEARYGRTLTVAAATSSGPEVPAGATATLFWSPTIDGTRTKIGTAVTGADGKVSFSTIAKRDGYWWMSVGGSWWRLPGESDGVRTRVRYAMTASATDLTPALGQAVRIYTLIQPAVKGAPVFLQKYVKGEWVTVNTLKQSLGGGASAWFTPRAARVIKFRFIAAPTDGYMRTVSPIVALDVHR